MTETINPKRYIRTERIVWHGSEDMPLLQGALSIGDSISSIDGFSWLNLGTETSDTPGSEGNKFDRLVHWKESDNGEVLQA